MRTKAIFIIIGFLLIIGLTGFLWGNFLISLGLEKIIQAIIGAKVDIEGLRLNPFKLSIQIGSVRITNPANTWKNILDTEKISFKIAPVPLFEGKTVIDEIVVQDLTFNTPRQTDGKLKKEAKPLPGPLGKAQAKLQQNIATMPILKPETIADNLDTEKITASYQFKTDLSAERISSDLSVYQAKWEANVNQLENTKIEFKSIDDKLAQIKKLNSKDLAELNQQLNLIKDTKSMVEGIRTEIGTVKNQLKTDNQALEDTIKGLKQEAKNDYQALLALAKVPDLGSLNYAEALLGKTMLNASTMILKLADEVQKSLPVKVGGNPPKEKPTRSGQNISFPGRKTHPRFLIKKIAISGKGTPNSFMDGFYASGTVTGITSEPPIYGLPIVAAVLGKAPNQAFLRLDGQINHVSPAFHDRVNLKLKNLPLPKIDFGDNSYLPSEIKTGKAEIDADIQITPSSMNLNILFTGKNIKSDFSGKKEPDDLISEIIRKTLAELNQVTIAYRLERIGDSLTMKISSNLNQLISDQVKESVGEKVTGFTNEIRVQVDAKLLEKQKKLDETKFQYQQQLTAKLNEVQTRLNLEEQELEAKKKELEAKIKELEAEKREREKEKEKEIQEKVQKELERLKDKL